MLMTLVTLESDLASSIALRYACQMTNIVEMGLQTIHVEEADAEGHPPGTGWVRRSWEKALKKNGEEQIAQLIRAERSSCPSMPATKVVLGDRDEEILLELNRESYDLYIEGMLYTYSSTNFFRKLHSRLYREAPCPIILVKNLLNLSRIALVLDVAMDPSSAVTTFLKIFEGAEIDLDVLCFRFGAGGGTTRDEEANSDGMLSHVRKLLDEGGRSPESCQIFQDTPARLEELFKDYGLAVSSLSHAANKKSSLADLLYHIPSPLLLCSP
jgi:hypothetical protein